MELKKIELFYYPFLVYMCAVCFIVTMIFSIYLVYDMVSELKETIVLLKNKCLVLELECTSNQKSLILINEYIKSLPETVPVPVPSITTNHSLNFVMNPVVLKYIGILLGFIIGGSALYWVVKGSAILYFFKIINYKLNALLVCYFPLQESINYTDSQSGYLLRIIKNSNTNICDIFVKGPTDLVYSKLGDVLCRSINFEPVNTMTEPVINTLTDQVVNTMTDQVFNSITPDQVVDVINVATDLASGAGPYSGLGF